MCSRVIEGCGISSGVCAPSVIHATVPQVLSEERLGGLVGTSFSFTTEPFAAVDTLTVIKRGAGGDETHDMRRWCPSRSAVPVRTQFLRAVAVLIRADEGSIQQLDVVLASGVAVPLDDDDAVLQLKVSCAVAEARGARAVERLAMTTQPLWQCMC